jgi:hypothetical protein
MEKFYLTVSCFLLLLVPLLPQQMYAQNCNQVTATYTTTESRCAATGMVQINVTGGSGTYQYKASGPVVTNFTSSSLITGLSAGRYQVIITDVVTNCVYDNDSITIDGNYSAPNFSMITTDVTCYNGNDGTITVTGLTNGRSPFSYKIIAPSASNAGLTNATGVFTGLISGNYLVQLSDSCGAIQTRNAVVQNYNWWIHSYIVTKIDCDNIAVTITLKDSKGNTSPHAIFNGFLYGISINPGDTSWFSTNSFNFFVGKKHTATLFVKDNCGNLKSMVWMDTGIPKVAATVTISNRACSTFTATITGQANLTNPQYCLYDSVKNIIACNTTGIFDLLPYGSYCINVRDDCYDTTITRCFTVTRPVPTVGATVNFTPDCKTYTATVTGQGNLNHPYYCIYDSSGTLLYCDSTGVFYNLTYSIKYCIKIINETGCFDTTITTCFNVKKPVPSVGLNVTITNLACSTFTAIIGDTANLNTPQFCLYTAPAHVLIGCNSTGIFNNLPYGSYCIDVINNPSCYDTTITRCFTVVRPKPAAGATVAISNKTCTTFTASITGQSNINNAQFCIYDSVNVLVSCNGTGVFNNLFYGTYCIVIRNDSTCYDTTFKRCFTAVATKAIISLTAKKSCITIGNTDLKVTISSGTPVYTLKLFSPAGTLLQTATTGSSSYTFSNIPGLAAALKYKIVVTDQCGSKDSTSITPIVSIINNVITKSSRCPSGVWPNGSADVLVDVTDNNIGGNIVPKIIKKNGVAVAITASSVAGYKYTFLDLGPAIYVFDTYVEDCNKHIYDTVEVNIYIFPILSGSNAYQCDNNGFSVGVSVAGGVGPYTYEIIGSVPASPAIVTAPQSSPVFSINNGTNYYLIRLRVIDGCGNASLYDVSVLPLANFLVSADSLECLNHSVTLRVDSMANAQYTWYKRIVPNDSIIVGTGPSLYFAHLALSDTGRYFCKIEVNNGCLVKFANYRLTGFCGILAPDDIILSGSNETVGNKLNWNTGATYIREYTLQKSTDGINYTTIARTVSSTYQHFDQDPFAGNNYYRLKLTTKNGQVKYSNVVLLKQSKFNISVYPNPVANVLYVAVKSNTAKSYSFEISNMMGQKIFSKCYTSMYNQVLEYPRTLAMGKAVYVLMITDLQTKEKQTYKLVYK